MSRKDFVALAAEIAKIENKSCRILAANAVADACIKMNPRFNRATFMDAANAVKTKDDERQEILDEQ